MFGSDDNRGSRAATLPRLARSPLIENIALAAAFLAAAVGFSVVLSQPLPAVANDDAFEPVLLVGIRW